MNEPVTIFFDVNNTGHHERAEVAELYVGESHHAAARPIKELKGFAKVKLKPGETKRVTIKLDRRAFSFYDVKTATGLRMRVNSQSWLEVLPTIS
ncbi:MAG: fibronectin type III-like domain-contianing protein [Candidatus Sulfotelmatobacter sp.]